MTQFEEWSRWALGGLAGLLVITWRHLMSLRKSDLEKINGRVGNIERAAESSHRRIDGLDKKVGELVVHVENGSAERAEIKHMIERLDDKIDKLLKRP